jgi:hypothetical protein
LGKQEECRPGICASTFLTVSVNVTLQSEEAGVKA